jgi:MOSC domain-containing protein YiiM
VRGRIEQLLLGPGGLPNFPVPEARATPLGLEGDRHRNLRVHGGPQKALLLVAAEALALLREAGYPLAPGDLGENLTTAGLDYRAWRPGQRWRAGEALIEFTRLRTPCDNLDRYNLDRTLLPLQRQLYDGWAKAGDPTSPVWARGGIYAAVLEPGLIRCGDIIVLLDQQV